VDAAAFDYDLPPAAIAQTPVEPRDSARLLVAIDPEGTVGHCTVADLPDLLDPGDVLVVNETKVLPARLLLRKATGGSVEVLLLEPTKDGWWEALVKPARRVPAGTVLLHDDVEVVEVGDPVGDDGRRLVRPLEAIDDHGIVPLPPYITEPLADPTRYQTVFARTPGSVAAPTAGLHLTEAVLGRCRGKGVEVVTVDLKVGIGTFRPITSENVNDHVMHSEAYEVPAETWKACQAARRVVAVGTTTVRALESSAATGRLEGRTDLFITPGYEFAVVDVLLTNFHMPRSSLLVLLEAFAGPRWRDLYREALTTGYRFLSFGDAMLVSRHGTR
jgi:S-adenosylmethionine:tRNA ribosyltransferase-isomerase